jgi:eukaryotic-like serine/threonine-protein kinase
MRHDIDVTVSVPVLGIEPLMAKRSLEKYEILEEVGHGGMAVVYRGIDINLNREVAVKVLHAHLAEDEESRQRFQREAHAVAKLRHDNIIEIYDYSGIESDESFIVTEFIHGRTLKEFLSRHPISHPEIAAMIIVEVCNALAHAHSLGIIHRDVKPENIMIRDDGRVKLTDFGIAQVIDVQRLTVTGQLLGSPAYMAPELVEGKRLDYRADVYSAGILLYQLATSELPFKGKNPHEVLKRISEGRYMDPEVANPTVGSKLSRVIRKALAHDPDNRYRDIAALRVELFDFLGDVGIKDPRDELRAYFASPAEFSRGLQERVVTALTERGKAALQSRRTPQALEFFNRVLCADPANREVSALLEQISRRRRIGRILAVFLLLAVLGGATALVARNLPIEPSTSAPSDGAASRPKKLAEAVRRRDLGPASARGLHDGGGLASRLADAGSAIKILKHLPIKILREQRRFEIDPTPKQVTIWLDGKQLGNYGPDLRAVNLTAGIAATLTFRNDGCCFRRDVTIGPKQAAGTLRVKLAWKPATVEVVVSPAGVPTDVQVGSVVTKPRQPVPVEIPSYSADGRAEVEVKVSAEGYDTESRKIGVRYNSTEVVRVTLRRAP